MKARSVWLVVVASMLLLATSQADFAFAALRSFSTNSTSQSISTGNWAVVAGADQNVTSADRAGSAYSTTFSSISSKPACTVVHWALYKSKTSSSFIGTLKKQVNVDYIDPNVMVGMPVSGSGIVAGNTIEAIDPILKTLTLTIGGNTGNNQDLTIGIPSGFDSSSSAFNATTSPYPVSPEGATWNNSSSGTADTVKIQDLDKFNKLKVGMLVQELVNGAIGTRIANSGTNVIKEKLTDGSKRIVLTNGGNSTLRYGELLFNNFCPGTSSGSNTGRAFFTIKNTGDLLVNSMSVTQTGTALSGGNSVTWSICGGLWNESTGACSASITSLLTTTSISGNQLLSLSLAPGDYVRVRAESSPAGGTATLNISISVSTSDLRAATSTTA